MLWRNHWVLLNGYLGSATLIGPRVGAAAPPISSWPPTARRNLVAALKPMLPSDTILCTDGSSALAASVKAIGVTHRPVNVSAGRRVFAGVYHIQNVNAYDRRLKN